MKVRAGVQLECATVVVFGGGKGVVRLELPLGACASVSSLIPQQSLRAFLARDQSAEEIEPQQVGCGADARVRDWSWPR